MEIGEKIRQIRKLSGLTQEQLAEKMSISRQTISKWESNITTPDLESIVRFSKLFQVSLDDLLLTEGETLAKGDEKITIKDLIRINNYNRKMTLLLISGLIFLMISILAVIVVLSIYSTTSSIQYMLYRYIAVGEYAYAPVEYKNFFVPAIVSGVIGVVLCCIYIIEKFNVKK